MPWHREPKKDATSCEKPRLAANKRYTRGCPNGETLTAKSCECYDEYIVITGEPAELKHLSRQRKRDQNEIPRVVASEIGRGQTTGLPVGYGTEYGT